METISELLDATLAMRDTRPDVAQKIFGRNEGPTEKPHLRKVGPSMWAQHWPDGWRQFIVVWRDACPRALPRHVLGSQTSVRPLNAGIRPFGPFKGE